MTVAAVDLQNLASPPAADAETVQRAAAGDRAACAALFRAYAPAVAETCARLLRSRTDAEDVVHDTFVQAFRELHSLRDPAAIRAWILRIAVSQVHRVFRRRRLRQALGLEAAGDVVSLERLLATDASPEERLEVSRAEIALRDVTDRARTAWILRRIEGYSLEEVAIACDVSLATVKRDVTIADERVKRAVAGDSK